MICKKTFTFLDYTFKKGVEYKSVPPRIMRRIPRNLLQDNFITKEEFEKNKAKSQEKAKNKSQKKDN